MAFAAAGLNCIAVGPTKLYIYNTADTLTSASIVAATDGFCTDNCPGMSAGDIILIGDDTNSLLKTIRITGIAATTCTYVERADLA